MSTDTLGHRLAIVERDSGLPAELVERFGAWVRRATDEELYRVPVLRWAQQHEVPEDEALRLFLHAAHTGIFEMLWGVLCPACGMVINTPGGLRALGPDPHCQLCRVDFPAAMDDQVEVMFTVEPAIRPLRFHDPARVDPVADSARMFFSPSMVVEGPHQSMISQVSAASAVPPRGRVTVTVQAVPGRMYAFVAASVHGVSFFQSVEGGPRQVRLEALDGAMIPPRGTLGAGPIEVELVNAYEQTLTLIVLDLGPHFDFGVTPPADQVMYRVQPFLSGKRVLTSQAFRDQFRGEVIGDSGLRIKNLAVLFTDLQSSTALYERVGDLRALALVREHFDRIGDVVARHRGAVVKTIGDAVMAAFGEPDRAVAAAAGIVRAVGRIDADGTPMAAKVGVHQGSCIAIQTNHQIDYFGTAVNVAARVQGLARGGEIVITDSVWNVPGVQGLVDDFGLRARPDRVDLRGIALGMAVQRLT